MKKIISNQGLIIEENFDSEIFNSDRSIYEVIRVIDGVAIFLKDHFERLRKSFKAQLLIFDMSFKEFEQNVIKLITENQLKNGNFKFVYSFFDSKPHWAFYSIPHSYPTEFDYINGVSTDLLLAERENPNAKVVQNRIRNQANQMIADRKLYEILLVDREGSITEGSRSNVFFVKNDVFYTAPESMILVGITRLKVIECIRKLGFDFVEQAVSKTDIPMFDAVFLTGTSPKVLPVCCIGLQNYATQLQCVKMVMECFDKQISMDINQNVPFK